MAKEIQIAPGLRIPGGQPESRGLLEIGLRPGERRGILPRKPRDLTIPQVFRITKKK